jgi:hypothetical protein
MCEMEKTFGHSECVLDRLSGRGFDGICCNAVRNERDFVLCGGHVSSYHMLWFGVWYSFVIFI